LLTARGILEEAKTKVNNDIDIKARAQYEDVNPLAVRRRSKEAGSGRSNFEYCLR